MIAAIFLRRIYLTGFFTALAAFLVLFTSSCGTQEKKEVPGLSGNLPLSVPQELAAGSPLEVTLGPVQGPDNTPVNLVMIGSYGVRAYSAGLRQGKATFSIPATDTQQSGYVNLFATSGAARGQAKIFIRPGQPVEPVEPLVGSRSIPVGQTAWSMVVVIPTDSYKNPVANGTAVQVKVQHPGSDREEKPAQVNNYIAWVRVFSGTKAGKTSIAAGVGPVPGPEEALTEFAASPLTFTLTAEPGTSPADGQTLLRLRSNVLRDKYGNVLPDGTLVTFYAKAPDGTQRTMPAYTVGGVAETPLQAPGVPGQLEVTAVVAGATSEPLEVVFSAGPAIGNFPVTVSENKADRSFIVEAGPMVGNLGQYIPDGTAVLFEVQDASGKKNQYQVLSKDGKARLELRRVNLAPGTYTVRAVAGSGEGKATFSVTGG